jgi:transcriptional regulator with XRE-family HTH domain
MPTHETPRQRGARRARELLQRTGAGLRQARIDGGLSLRQVASSAGISHTHLRRIEGALAPHVDIDVLARIAEVVGYQLSLAIHPIGTPLRDAAHLALLARFRRRIHASLRWASEVVVPISGDLRSADAVIAGIRVHAMVEAETRLGDIQALERRISAKARDLGLDRVILLVLDSRHNREVIRTTPELSGRFPISTRMALAALGRGEDPGGDCLIVL